jgi:ectoine hydroxylase-related dioxygenase (phytanoyl-CoA dioxygenase family)
LPGSHKYFNELFPIGIEWPYIKYKNIITDKAKTIYAKKGDMIAYDQNMIHGSWRNLSSEHRPVVHTGVQHKDAELLFYKVEGSGSMITLTAYNVESDFYLSISNFSSAIEKI